MKVIILAAGLGSRLDDTSDHLPKPLTELLGGKSILGHQLHTLASFISLDRVLVVVGYRKEVIIEQFPDLLYLYNPNFSKENTSKSLERALRKIEEDVIWLNGDVVFKPSVIQKVIESNCTGMVVNQTVVGEEEVKYRTNSQGQIVQVSKQVQNAEGEALGINFFKKEDIPWLREALVHCQPNDYFEKGIEIGIQQGHIVRPIPVDINDCAEIDFPEDLQRANQMLARWNHASQKS